MFSLVITILISLAWNNTGTSLEVWETLQGKGEGKKSGYEEDSNTTNIHEATIVCQALVYTYFLIFTKTM